MSDVLLTREQRYAKEVYEHIKPFIGTDSTRRKAYGSLAHKLPVLIRTAGLAQALAFVAARNRDNEQREQYSPQLQLIKDLAAVLITTRALEAISIQQEDSQRQQDTQRMRHLVERSRTAPFDEYLRLTEAALEALLWFKRFAQSELKVDSANADQEPEVPNAA